MNFSYNSLSRFVPSKEGYKRGFLEHLLEIQFCMWSPVEKSTMQVACQ